MKSTVVTWVVFSVIVTLVTAPIVTPTLENLLARPTLGFSAIAMPYLHESVISCFSSYYFNLFAGKENIGAFCILAALCSLVIAFFIFNYRSKDQSKDGKDSFR